MATKLQFYQAVAERTAGELTARSGNWLRFLDTAARLYKYPFHDQMMIYAQRPDATACAELELWNERFNRWVRRGAKGVALIDDSGSYPRLKYVFDVSDTEPSLYRARPVKLWEMRREHKAPVLSELAKNYEDIDLDGTLADAFRSIAKQLAREYYDDNRREIAFRSENSVLEPEFYDDGSGIPIEQSDDSALSAEFVASVSASVAYAVMTRCGLDASEHFDESDFWRITDFNTPDMAHALGVASAELSSQVLRDIEIVIRKYERLKNAERSEQNHDRNPYLHAEGRLSPAGHHAERAAEGRSGAAGTLGQDAESVPERTPEDNLQPPADLGEAVSASAGSGRGGESEVRADYGVADPADGSAGQSDRAGEVDGGDEHAESAGDGSDSQRTDLHGLEPVQSEETDKGAAQGAAPSPLAEASAEDAAEPSDTLSQIETRRVAEILSASPITMDEADAVLRSGGNFDDHHLNILPTESRSALRIAAYFAKGMDGHDNAEYLKGEYLLGRYGRNYSESGKGFDFGNHRVCAWFTEEGIELAVGVTAKNNIHKVIIPWESAAVRIDELMREGRYVSRAAYDVALNNERIELADDLWNFYRDDMHKIPEEWRGESHGHPDDVAKIKSLLDDADERQAIAGRLTADVRAWLDDPEKTRSWHNPPKLPDKMETAMRPPVIPPGDGAVPEKKFSYFITQDEIDAALTHGGSYTDGKFRFLSFLLGDHDAKEKTEFFKREYGHGGGTWDDTNGWREAEPGKGVSLRRGGIGKSDSAVEVNLKWPAVIRRTEQLIYDGLYMTRAELDRIPNYERLMLVRSVNNFYSGLPDEYERPFPGKTGIYHNEYRDENGNKLLDFHYPHEAEWEAVRSLLDNPERVEAVLSQMRYIFENTSEDDRYYGSRKIAFEHLSAYRAGTYTLFPGLEKLPDPETAARGLAPRVTPRREIVEDLRESSFGGPVAGAQPRAVQLSLFEVAEESPLPILPSALEQQTKISETLREEAAEIQAASSLERDSVDAFLLDVGISEKTAIAERFSDNPRSRDAANLVKEIYGDALTIPLPQAMKRIAELVAGGAFAAPAPYSLFDRVRNELSERGYAVSDELIEVGVNDYNAQGGKGDFQDVSDFIESEYLTDEIEQEAENDTTQTKDTKPDVLQEYEQTKRENGGAIVLWQVEDSYEIYGEDASAVADELVLTLARTNLDSHDHIPMCGFPASQVSRYITLLNEMGLSVVASSVGADNNRREYFFGANQPIEETRYNTAPEQQDEPQAEARPYKAGDTVWLDNREFLIDAVSEQYKQPDGLDRTFGVYGRNITLMDVALSRTYPITRSMYQTEFENALARDERNAHLAPLGEPAAALAPPDFDAVKQTVYDRVMADENYAYHLRFAESRGALRKPLNDALDKAVAELKEAEPAIYGGYFDDDVSDDLFDYVYRTAWENRPQPKPEKEQRQAAEAAEIPTPRYGIGDFITIEDTRYRINGIAEGKITLRDIGSDEFVSSSRIMGIEAFEKILNDNPSNLTIMPKAEQSAAQEEIPEGFTEITDPAELAEIERIFDGGQRAEPLAVIDNVSRNNFNLFALAFPRLIDGAYQSMTFRDADNRELSVSYATTGADVINLDVSYYKPDGHRAFAPMIQFCVNHENRMLTVNGYADDDRNEDAGFLRLADKEQLSELNVRAYGYLSNIRNIGFDLTNPVEAEVFLDADGNPLPAEPKSDIASFLKERADRESDAHGRVQTSMFAPLPEPEREQKPTQAPKPAHNFRITDDQLGEGGAKTKFRGNIKALQTLKDIESENRPATPEEQETLSRYIGWGGLPQVFDPDNKDWANEYLELNALLTPEEFESARASTLNAHYTSPIVIKAIWETIARFGFDKGNILEPSMGVGNFFGLIPNSMRGSKLYGVELDSVTARIAMQLYPKANIRQTGFEKTEFSDAFFDLAVGNVPFGEYSVADKRYDKHKFSIHNYFFAKALDKVRPGGVVAFVTSKYTMDSRDPKVRKYLAERAELLGAARLPNNAFFKNAGTETTMDILFLQKRDRPLDTEPDWVHLGLTDDGIHVNRYFLDNPETVCGVMGLDERMNNKFGRDDMTACLPTPGADLGEQLRAALLSVHGTFEVEEPDDLDGVDNHAIPADSGVKNFSYAVVDGTVYFRENSLMYPVDLPQTTLERIRGMIGLRDCVHTLIDFQLDDFPDSAIERQQSRLNALYDSFIAEFGLIGSQANSRAFNADSAYYLLSSLEVVNEDGELLRKADMFSKRTIKQKTVITHVDTASEALAVSIGERGYVDLDYMAGLTGFEREKLLDDLRGVVFLNVGMADSPTKAYVTADEYLSGNVREKLKLAEAAAISVPSLSVNAEALRAALPKDLEAGDISVRLGATWIDPKYVQEFMYELLDTSYYNKKVYQVLYHSYTGEWQVTGKGKTQFSDIHSTVTYGTGRMNAYQILDDTLNLRDVRVYDYKEDADGKERRVLNKKETMLAQQKQEAIKQAFKEWIWKDPERRQTLVKEYNEKFNSVRPREYDGSHITFGGITGEIELRPHQLNAIAHILYGGNTLLAHEVGAGKTFEMVAAAMEAKRLGQCHKSLFAVPNHLTEQWAAEFLRLYPSANILVAAKRDFEPRNRKKFCAKIATGDYDAVIIGHSQLEKIPMSRERQERLIREQIWEIEQGIRELKDNNGERFSIKQLEKTKKSLEARLAKLLDAKQKDDVVTFEQLGCDRLYIDEAHNFKNLFMYTKMRNVAGLSTSEAQKSSDLFMKCRYLDELTEGKGVIFATGTPISNSMTEMFTMQRYLQHDRLAAMGLLHFDAWASIFGETQTSIELAPEGTGYRARTRFAKFHNLPELMCLFKEVADIQTADMLSLPVPDAKFENIIVEPSDLQKEMVEELSERAARVHDRKVEPNEDNMLKITTDGRKIGLDQRLMNPLLPDFEGSKVNACTDKVFGIWRDTSKDRLTQLVFCDFSTPNKDGRFNVYDDIRGKLIERGIPESEIAFIHDADTETKKKELFAKVRQGKVRVLFGSTFKMGSGTNVQDRLIAIHDADCPWRPADLAQRAGRIVRQGNKNAEVRIFRYATSGTFVLYCKGSFSTTKF